MPSLLCYGSYGYVGRQVAEELLERGIEPILAGRDREQLAEQVAALGLHREHGRDRPARRFDLEDPSIVDAALADVDCVLNCAGPFSNTAEPLVEACLRTGTDYVDVTGEIPVIEAIHDRNEEATDAGVTLLPAAGFSSVPLDCLAAHLAERLPEATSLALGVDSFRIPSIGTLRTVIEGSDTGGAVRRDGRLEGVPANWRTRRIDFGRGTRPAVTMPLGDVSTAYYSTGIPDIEVYALAPQPARLALAAHRYLAPVLAAEPVQWAAKKLAGVREGPSARARRRGVAYLWGEARTDDERVVSRLRTPDPYVVTVDAAATVAERVLAGDAPAGYQTPATAFGADFVLELEDVECFYDEERPPDPEGRGRKIAVPLPSN